MAGVGFEHILEHQIRALLDQLRSSEAADLAEQIDLITHLDHTRNALDAEPLVRMVDFARQRTQCDRAEGAWESDAGRGAAAEIAMARRLAVRTVESQLGYGTVLVDDFPHLLGACRDGRVPGCGLEHRGGV